MLHVGNIMCLPRLSSFPYEICLYSPVNNGNILEAICPFSV